ncbi:MAG: hypothetical protein ACXW3E_07120, partial [Thermoanaerobaculia bacterium]
MSNDVVIVVFSRDRAAEGLAGAGERLAKETGGRVVEIAIDPAEYQIEECLAALTETCRELNPRAILLSNDTYSQEIAPRLAHRLGGSAVGDGVDITPDLRVTRQVYGGKAQAVIQLKRTPAVVWLRARSFDPPSGGQAPSPSGGQAPSPVRLCPPAPTGGA